MHAFETLIGLLLVAITLAAVARRVGAPYPALLALGGAVLAFIPGVPVFSIPPDLALAPVSYTHLTLPTIYSV